LTQGNGAAAMLVGTGEVIARVIATHGVTVDFADHFRGIGADFDCGEPTLNVSAVAIVGLAGA
jgi:3-hydroxy-3-methylglutaryl CoA synthase